MNERIRLHVSILTGVLKPLTAAEQLEVLQTAAVQLGLSLVDVTSMNLTIQLLEKDNETLQAIVRNSTPPASAKVWRAWKAKKAEPLIPENVKKEFQRVGKKLSAAAAVVRQRKDK